MRESYERDIQDLLNEVLVLGSMVEQATLAAVEALEKRNVDKAKQVYKADIEVNRKRFEIEEKTLIQMATQGPMATDLRLFASILEISTELERMGDYAKGIAKIAINMEGQRLLKPLVDLPKMSKLTVEFLHEALEAFVNLDGKKAYDIARNDDAIDDLFKNIQTELVHFMINDSESIDKANQLMWASHNLERMGDRVVNICERTIFVTTGEMTELSFSDDEKK
jgi:phosphate transport system protein